MSLEGLGAVAIWHDLLPEAKDNFYEWHNREHMPERLAIPGFLRGRRYISVRGDPEFFNLYETASEEVLVGQDYLARLNQPTDWTRESVKAFRHVSRSICRVEYTDGIGQGGLIATLRFDVVEHARASLLDTLRQRILPAWVTRKGVVGVHLCLADVDGSQVETAEKKARDDITLVPTWVVLIEGTSTDPLSLAATTLQQTLAGLGTGASELSIYQLEYSRSKTPYRPGTIYK